MIFILLLIVIDAYLCLTLLQPLLSSSPVFYGVALLSLQLCFAAMAWLFFVFFKGEADDRILFEKPIRTFAFNAMGMISFLTVFTLFRDLVGLLLLAFGKGSSVYGSHASFLILGTSTLCFIVGTLNAQYQIFSPRVEIPVKDLPASLQGLRMVQLSDIHLGTGPNSKQVGKLVDRALSLKPDLIVLTGDIIDGNIADITEELKELTRLQAPQGVYFVLGNHECYWKPYEAIEAIQALGFTVLQNEGVEKSVGSDHFFIAGLNDPAFIHAKGEGPKIPEIPANSKLNLILVHQPHFAHEIAKHPYHLQLSGHTHGGQFFPWNLAVKKVHEFDRGLKKLKNLSVYVNMGSGYWGPPLRLGSQCEVTELVFVPA